MNGMEMEQMGPQNFLYGCELKADKDVTFSPEDDDCEHQLSLRMVCVDPSTKDELHVVEVQGHDCEGQEVKAVLATLKPSSLPSVCLGGFEISPPAVFRLVSGPGPIHISGQHLVMTDGDQSFDEDDEDEEEVRSSTKRPAIPSTFKPQKKMKMEEEGDEEDDDDDEEDDDEEEGDEEEDSPVKPKKTPSKSPSPAQNGNTPKATSTGKQTPKAKTPKAKSEKGTPKTPQTPKAPLTLQEVQKKMMSSIEKGVMLPKVEAKFENYVKNGFRVNDSKMIQELWKWRQTVKDRK